MKKVFLDTNIIVDLIADRKPFSKYAIEIFQLAEENKLEIFTSSHSIATTHYLLKKYLDEKSLRDVLYNLLDFLTVIPVDVDIIKKGLRSSHKDFEDSIQILCASSIEKINYIITRDGKDFKGSEIPVLSPDEFFLIK
ncbi:type II toxin-antitoxin system VapC family toxin [Flavobacterium selenitireducens]|uniref:type II toxin-antitoxin system VapC family toxin n=1 Tax=Flavobacterium selenitireducens TaxID=2722704 RepID=UPI00168ACAE0|nr:PIN domain-containing protein [Flavobacterium selenitireducens]MBD3583922.1 PIN domain-containing protein [Flavobacterium selenitireducens]